MRHTNPNRTSPPGRFEAYNLNLLSSLSCVPGCPARWLHADVHNRSGSFLVYCQTCRMGWVRHWVIIVFGLFGPRRRPLWVSLGASWDLLGILVPHRSLWGVFEFVYAGRGAVWLDLEAVLARPWGWSCPVSGGGGLCTRCCFYFPALRQ